MHELSIAHAIVRTVVDALPEPEAGPGRITSVRVAVGALSGVVPQALQFAYDAAAEGTPLADAALQIDQMPVVIDCPTCGRQDLAGTTDFHCPSCKTLCGNVVGGKELQVLDVSFEEAPVGTR